jgi:hypothetical protein
MESELKKPECPFCYVDCIGFYTCCVRCVGIAKHPECDKDLYCSISDGDSRERCDPTQCENRLKAYVTNECKRKLNNKLEALCALVRNIGDGK